MGWPVQMGCTHFTSVSTPLLPDVDCPLSVLLSVPGYRTLFSTLNRSRLLREEDGWGRLEGVGCNTREEVGPKSRIWSSAVSFSSDCSCSVSSCDKMKSSSSSIACFNVSV